MISLEYAKHFEMQTCAIARGCTHVLYVDGHDSHITCEFIKHCRAHKIRVPSYPTHGMHIYQTLDVGVFALLKLEYGKLRDKHLRDTGEAIMKENFLKIYREAHLKVLKLELIQMVFQKVGIVPFNQKVVTKEMMVPSHDTSYKVYTPVVPPKAVQIVTDLLMDAVQPPVAMLDKQSAQLPLSPSRPVCMALPLLASSDAGFLTMLSSIKASSQPPDLQTMEVSPVKHVMKMDTNHSATKGNIVRRDLFEVLEA